MSAVLTNNSLDGIHAKFSIENNVNQLCNSINFIDCFAVVIALFLSCPPPSGVVFHLPSDLYEVEGPQTLLGKETLLCTDLTY